MHWYVVHTKPRQEKTALYNLQQQGYPCYLPMLLQEKIRQGEVVVVDEPLFPRYLFIQLGRGISAQSWSPIRSTPGVSRLVSFGAEPAKVHDALIEALQAHEAATQHEPQALFKPGERVRVTDGPFCGLEGIYQMAEGDRRAMVLIELLCKPVVLPVAPVALRRVA